ncbi:hypothetical protein RTM1035_11145 [Roseovarius sp. TM1035]|nr:hypothetical protein RTM1035_11145 [Roseovarius sp. TM1035]
MRAHDIAVPVLGYGGLGRGVFGWWRGGQSGDDQGGKQQGHNGGKRGGLRGAGWSFGAVAEILGHGPILLVGWPEGNCTG